MLGLKTVGCTSLMLLTLASAFAAAAQASEGPFYRVENVPLGNNATEEIKANAVGSQSFATAKGAITCRKLKLKLKEGATPGARIIGTMGGNFEKSEIVVEYTGCSVTGNGEKCAVEGEKFKTEVLSGALAFGEKVLSEGTPIYIIFSPKVGTVIAKPKFAPEAGGACTVGETNIAGSVGAEAFGEGKPVRVKEEPKEAVTNEINFPKERIKKYFLETNGAIGAEEKPSLTAFGEAATVEGKLEVELVSEKKWRVSS